MNMSTSLVLGGFNRAAEGMNGARREKNTPLNTKNA